MERTTRRKAARVLVPAGVVALTAAGIGLVPAMAGESGPKLPELTAEQVVAKALGSDVQALSGTVKLKADLGLPTQLLGGALPGGGAPGGHGGGEGSEAAPEAKLLQLLGGEHTLRVAVDGPDRQRLGLIGGLSGYELVHNGSEVWAWDSRSNEAVHLTGAQAAERAKPELPLPVTPQEAAKKFLELGADTTQVTVEGTATVAGQPAYELRVKPKQSGSTISEVRIAVAAENGVPLAVQVRSGSTKVLDARFSEVSFATPSADTFRFTAPKGAKVTEENAGVGQEKWLQNAPDAPDAKAVEKAGRDAGFKVTGEGWTTVLSARLPAEATGGEAGGFAKALGKPVGGGSLISTKVVNVLITDDGRVFAGAVTPQVLQSAAGAK
ncbi:outer membrane lipoprotein carrier protein LolA [Kitasatospora sp. NPDC051853]|uniref:outer membrane lipoprotein carrier protein LolA n=1 Tax=Kitasatospora sp. NPDC051853 TaxID=3364058 RepID=UPI003791E7C5